MFFVCDVVTLGVLFMEIENYFVYLITSWHFPLSAVVNTSQI